MENKICKCGHDRVFHRHNWSGSNEGFFKCEHSRCWCKKFKAWKDGDL